MFKKDDFSAKFLKRSNFEAPFRPSTLKKNFLVKLRVGSVYVEKSFETIFNMGFRGGRGLKTPPPPYVMGL